MGAAQRTPGRFAPGAGRLPLWILNASTRPFLELRPDELAGTYLAVTRDKLGRVVDEQRVTFPLERLAVEVGGSVEILAQ